MTGDVTVRVTPPADNAHTRPKGIIVRGNKSVEIDGKTNVSVTLASENNPNMSPDSNAAYGIAVGYDWNGGNSSDTATLTLKDDAVINVDNTAGTVLGSRSFSGATAPFGHQLSGVKIFRRENNPSATPIFNSEKSLTINVEDKTTAKIGDYFAGIYISGDGAQANLKDSEITIKGNGRFSAALKIGKPELPNRTYSDSYQGATINSSGKMILDTTETVDSATVRLFGTKSRLIADSDTSSGEIKSGNSAIVFDVQDYDTNVTYFITDKVSRNEPNKDQEVRLNNTKLSTTSDTASLILAEAKSINSIAVTFAGSRVGSWFNNGNFAAENAKFTLKGQDSEAKAADNGWLAETKFEGTKAADLSFNLDNKAKIIGLMHQNSRVGLTSKLDVSLDNQALWELAPKQNESVQRTTIYDLQLNNGAILDASKHAASGADGTDYKIALLHGVTSQTNTQNIDNGTLQITSGTLRITSGTLQNADGTVQTIANQNVPINGRPLKIVNGVIMNEAGTLTVTEGRVTVNSGALETDSGTVSLGSNTLTTASGISTLTGNILVPEMGVLTNNNSIINLANNSSQDKLTIEGNYSATDGILRVNTEWNNPGDDQGSNSTSDLLEITGRASGNTNVIAVGKNGNENLIDGSIGAIAADLHKISAPVVRVLGADNGIATALANTPFETRSTFTGSARTTGAGEVQLASRVGANGETEYFWTITTVNPNTPNTPIITPIAPAYSVIPKQNLELGYTMLGTLHQRRGENQTLSWDNQGEYGKGIEKQSWGRIIGKHLKADGKNRFNFSSNIYGFQVGHDFDVKTTDNGGRRFTGIYAGYLQSRTKFYDEYRAQSAVVINDKFASKVKSRSLNIGATHTRYDENGSYVDLVGQLAWLNNHYSAVDGSSAKNHGIGVTLSAEAGRPYALGKDKTNNGDSWILEPQAQLIYQHLHLSDFHDGTRTVKQKGKGLRGRVGARLAFNAPNDQQRTKTVYLIGNIWHDFHNKTNAQIGADNLHENMAKTWWELGLGTQWAISENTYLYADARYERAFSSSKHKGYQGTMGVKYSW